MLIHAYKRKEAMQVSLGALLIDFKPNKAGEVVANVTDQKAIDRLLSIGEAYREHGADEAAVEPDADATHDDLPEGQGEGEGDGDGEGTEKPKTGADVDPLALARKAQVLIGYSKGDAPIEIDGKPVEVQTLIDRAFTRSGLTKSGWNAQEQADIDTAIETEANALALEARQQLDAKNAAALPTKYVITSAEGVKIDLARMDDKKLRSFAKTNGVVVASAAKGNKIRDAIVAAIKGAAGTQE